MSRSEANKIAQPLHGINPAIIKSLISQKYQFFLGALLLGMSFLLQLVKALDLMSSASIVAYIHQIEPFYFVPGTIAILLCAWWSSCALTKRALEKAK